MTLHTLRFRYAWSLSNEEEEEAIDYSKPWDMSDVTFIVEGRLIYASKTILSMWSPVLKAMFTDDFKEKNAVEIVLPDKHYEDMMELVKVLHPPNADLDESNVGLLLPLAREYQMDGLMRRCELFLLSRPLSVQSLALAEEFTLASLKMHCMDYVAEAKLSELDEQPEFNMLNTGTKVTILHDKSKKYEHILSEIHAVVNGNKPDKIQFREGGTFCTFTCPDKEGPHGDKNPFAAASSHNASQPSKLTEANKPTEKPERQFQRVFPGMHNYHYNHSEKVSPVMNRRGTRGGGAGTRNKGREDHSEGRVRKGKKEMIPHSAGTEPTCKCCALYMVKKIKEMTNTSFVLNNDS